MRKRRKATTGVRIITIPAAKIERLTNERGLVTMKNERGLVTMKPAAERPKRTKVAIVGFASSSRDQAPYDDQSFEIWSLNHAHQFIRRWDRWFQIHPTTKASADVARAGQVSSGDEHGQWLTAQDGSNPVYMQDHYEEIKASVRYPREEINKWFEEQGGKVPGFFATDYYTSTISQMLALAIYEGFSEIHLYGIDLLQEEEYFYQRAGCEYLIGFARGRGAKVYIPKSSALCKAGYVYGYTEPMDQGAMTPFVTFIKGQRDLVAGKRDVADKTKHVFSGATQMADVALELWDKLEVPEELKAAKDAIGALYKPPVQAKRVEMNQKSLENQTAVIALEAQRMTFEATVSWAEHFGRGGTLEAA